MCYQVQGRRKQVLKDAIATSEHWKVGFKSFPTVYDMAIWGNMGGGCHIPLESSTFQPKYGILRTSNVLSPGVLEVKCGKRKKLHDRLQFLYLFPSRIIRIFVTRDMQIDSKTLIIVISRFMNNL